MIKKIFSHIVCNEPQYYHGNTVHPTTWSIWKYCQLPYTRQVLWEESFKVAQSDNTKCKNFYIYNYMFHTSIFYLSYVYSCHNFYGLHRFYNLITTSSQRGLTCLKALAKASIAIASFPGVCAAKFWTAFAISISEQPACVDTNHNIITAFYRVNIDSAMLYVTWSIKSDILYKAESKMYSTSKFPCIIVYENSVWIFFVGGMSQWNLNIWNIFPVNK